MPLPRAHGIAEDCVVHLVKLRAPQDGSRKIVCAGTSDTLYRPVTRTETAFTVLV